MDPIRLFALAVAVVGAAFDLRTRRIPNLLTFGSSVAALACHGWTGGVAGLGQSAGGWAIGTALFLPLFALGGMGAGDVKLLGAVGAWMGPSGALWSGVFSMFAGGALALVLGARHRYLGTAFRNLWRLLGSWRSTGIKPIPGLTLMDSTGPRLAYGVAIALGTLAAAVFK